MNDELQVENGNFTRIVNKVLDELVKIPLLGRELAILLFIIRKTYGFQKTSDIISISQIEKGTKTGRPTVVKALKNLVIRNMIVKTPLLDGRISLKFNKYNETWVVKTPKLVKEKWVDSKDPLTETSKDPLTHKRKKEMTKETTEQSSEQIGILIKSFEGINTNAKNFYGRNPQRKACQELITDFGFDRVKSVIENTLPKTNRMEYMPTITTPIQLLEKWSSLEAGILKLKGKQKEKSKIAFQ